MHNTISVIRQSIQMSLQNIKSNKMRTFLTTLGIIIGVTAVIALITIVDGVIGSVMGQFSSLGAGTLSVSITGSSLKKGLTESDLDSIEQLDNVSGISPSVSITTTAARPGKLLEQVSVQGKNDSYFLNNDLISYGRGITRQDVENESYVCIIDQDLADNLFAGEDPLGSQLIVGGIRYTVIGLQGEDSNLMASMAGMGGTMDGTVTIPYTNALKLSGNSSITSLDVYVADTDRTQELQEAVESVLYKAFNENEDCYNVFSMDSLLDTMESMMSMMTYMLTGIASIALLVGGIGIMNMMLVSVTERTTEIGLRKALGAEPYQIQAQFLIESFLLSFCGGILGLAFGELLVLIFSAYADISASITLSSAILGLSFSGAIGILFGWAPARKASNLNPIDALRSV